MHGKTRFRLLPEELGRFTVMRALASVDESGCGNKSTDQKGDDLPVHWPLPMARRRTFDDPSAEEHFGFPSIVFAPPFALCLESIRKTPNAQPNTQPYADASRERQLPVPTYGGIKYPQYEVANAGRHGAQSANVERLEWFAES